ncbi:single-strand DNA endonuclease 1 [Mercurialis annua]|uniref:single-strand DNA endonuclease 1 n=1 Tax=Mercurialis annua TaxID=3986 RepID=UPI00215E2A5D|nr:single-strand DNA endonuclease 1 [Mercurialis annua]
MGVKSLWEILESCKIILPLHHLQNKRVCIDLSCWIVQLQNVNKSQRCAVQDKLYLRGLFHRLRALIALNCTLIFVADGSIPGIKLSTYRQRLNSGHEVTQDETNMQEPASSLPRNMGSEFSRMIKEAKTLGLSLGIPCLDGLEEAEAQCALLNSESLCDGCFTSDSDVFLFGARTVYRDICLGEGGYVVCYEMDDIERKLGFGRNSLITLALLLGCDYSQGVRGLGPESACQIVKSVGDHNVLQRIAIEGMSFAKKIRAPKKQTKLPSPDLNVEEFDKNLEKRNEFVQVINAYMKPKCHSADSDLVYRILAALPIQREKLQRLCAQFFGWSSEKTDEYILPKIAERDLRRFANLRLTSSELGVNLPMCEIPVKCPVSEIVKSRKVQGKECFEVRWERLDGLETSIVPADLVESACPERIAEFEQKRALGKKQNHRKPRTKKAESRSTVAEINLMLQNLMLDIESESNTALNDSVPSRSVISGDSISSKSVVSGDFVPSKSMISGERTSGIAVRLGSKSNLNNNAASSSCYVGASLPKNEVIDLLSPSPAPPCRMVSRCQPTNDQFIDVINLSDSETEMSPEHVKKGTELSSFLASIRYDIS